MKGVQCYELFGGIAFKNHTFSFSFSIEYMKCPEFSTIPAVFISDTTSTEVNKGTLLSEVRVATVRMCKSNDKGVWVEGEVYHL